MANKPILRLNLVDVSGKPINEKVDVILRHRILSDVVRAEVSAKGPVNISGLKGFPQGAYKIEIDPPSYQYVAQFINIKSSGVTTLDHRFPVDPSKVVSVKFPSYEALDPNLKSLLENSPSVEGFSGLAGNALYNGLANDDIRRAGLLNIAAKCAQTKLTGGKMVLPYLRSIRSLRGDRFFADVPKELVEDVKNSVSEKLFHPADGSLHKPEKGFKHTGSFKTPDRYGNLQLTFFRREDEFVADIDIDDAGGFEHVFQVLKNALSGKPTHPFNIHEILIGIQQIDPGYSFNLR